MLTVFPLPTFGSTKLPVAEATVKRNHGKDSGEGGVVRHQSRVRISIKDFIVCRNLVID